MNQPTIFQGRRKGLGVSQEVGRLGPAAESVMKSLPQDATRPTGFSACRASAQTQDLRGGNPETSFPTVGSLLGAVVEPTHDEIGIGGSVIGKTNLVYGVGYLA